MLNGRQSESKKSFTSLSDHPIFNHIKNKNHSAIIAFLTGNPDQSIINKDNQTPLRYAAEQGFWDIVELMLQHPPKTPLLSEMQYGSVLLGAIDAGKTAIAIKLIPLAAKESTWTHTLTGDHPLHLAIRKKNSAVARSLILQKNMELSIKNKAGDTPLHLAVQHSQFDTISLLLIRKAAQLIMNNSGQNPIQLAASSGSWNIVEMILLHLNCSSYSLAICISIFNHANLSLKNQDIKRYAHFIKLLIKNNSSLAHYSNVVKEAIALDDLPLLNQITLAIQPSTASEEKKASYFQEAKSFRDACIEVAHFNQQFGDDLTFAFIRAIEESNPSVYVYKLAYIAQKAEAVDTVAFYFETPPAGHSYIGRVLFEAIASTKVPEKIQSEFKKFSSVKCPPDVKDTAALTSIDALRNLKRTKLRDLKSVFDLNGNETHRYIIRTTAGIECALQNIFTCDNYPNLEAELIKLFGRNIFVNWVRTEFSNLLTKAFRQLTESNKQLDDSPNASPAKPGSLLAVTSSSWQMPTPSVPPADEKPASLVPFSLLSMGTAPTYCNSLDDGDSQPGETPLDASAPPKEEDKPHSPADIICAPMHMLPQRR